ncbi:hypothetical protein SynWH8103_02637 [Synechococcus sp. WH 8103]|nr:hypothetical protein SynRS9915_02642 [Synechococcus sp. RS9915]QNJ15282.1 hypothetical protein SynA18461_02673 [Synechococcus sp. A18-46.1]CRY93316.1 hypothetical protein SynWH8103_02637 [Synechococcus sp. WH 8103]
MLGGIPLDERAPIERLRIRNLSAMQFGQFQQFGGLLMQ